MKHLAEMEPRRLAALLELGVLDTEPEPIFDSLTELALRTFNAPVAVISLVDKDRQWFKACIGLPVSETPRDVAFCDHAIRSGDVLVVLDATVDPRFAQNPLVTGEPGIRFYAGAPLTTPDGFRIGTLCLIDFTPRATFDPDEAAQLQHIANAIMQALVMRAQASDSARKTAEAEEKADLLGLSERLAKVGYWVWDPASDDTVWSPETYRIHGFDPAGPAPPLDGVLALYQADDAAALAACVERAVTMGESYDLEARIIRSDGEIRHVMTSAAARRDSNGRVSLLQGSFQDITELRLADAKLRRSEERYRQLADNATDVILEVDPESRIAFASPSIRHFGYRPEDVVGRPANDFVHPDELANLNHRRLQVGQGEARGSFEMRFLRADGGWTWIESNPAPIQAQDGRIIGIITVLRDISRRKAAEAALQDSEARYRLLTDNAKDMILQSDLEGQIVYASPSVRQLGYSPAEIIDRPRGALIHPDDAEGLRERLAAAGRGEAVGSFEARVLRADGEWVWTESNPAPVRDADGRIVGVVSVARDISARKASEAARLESEAKYRLLADNSTDLVMTYDLEGRVSYVSPSIRRYGYQPEEMIGREIGRATHADDRPRVLQAFQDALGGQRSLLETLRARFADGRWAWFEGRMSPLYDDAGHLVGALAVNRDISARLAAEQALGEVNAELTRVTRISIMGAFSASIAHEINQPLTALVANSETASIWLSQDPPDVPMAQQAIKRAARDALRASETIARMRALATKGPPTITEFDVNDAIREVLALTQSERLRTKVIARTEIAPHPLMIRADRIQVQQVLLNLIGNAIEAMRAAPEDERRLMIRSGLAEDGQVRVEIEDRGAGLDQDTAERIFDYLFTTKTGGTGLGLSISRSIIESHGGRIWAGTAAPNGAVFRFELPSSSQDEAAEG